MSKIVKGVAVIVLLLGLLCACCYADTHYTRKECVVVDVEERLVTVQDKQGYWWQYHMDSEDYADVPCVGAIVNLRMYTAHTDGYIYDDEIVGVRVVVQ